MRVEMLFEKSRILFIAVFCTISISGLSQEAAKTDTLLSNQKVIIQNQEKMMGEILYDDPLAGKRFGVELNPVYFLASSAGEEGFILTGGVSLFSVSDKAEIAFPFYYAQGSDDLSILSVDCHYRNFLGKHRKGFYISSGLRFTSLQGREGYSYFSGWDEEEGRLLTESKLGLTFGIGYRKYGYNGWYWGTSLFGGKYFSDEELNISGGGLANSQVILDMEILKIGKMF